MRIRVSSWSVVCWLLPAFLAGCHAQNDSRPARGIFRDVTKEAGIAFRQRDGRSGEKFYVETSGSTGGVLDFDRDGDLDIYLVNAALGGGRAAKAPPRNVMYENRGGRFVDVSDRLGVADEGYGNGFCAGDFDGDGWIDFYVTNYGPNRLYRNLEGKRFVEVGGISGVDSAAWGTGCAFGDLDDDGDLDLYVANYVKFSYDENPYCGDRARGLRAYCRPSVFDGEPDLLFLNQGDGTFREAGRERGLALGRDEKGFGVLMTDIDRDGDLDVYVANDGTMNRLYVNDGQASFEDGALIAGVGFNDRGLAESGMGVDAGDYDGDGRTDIIVTNYSMESNTLYRQSGPLLFDDATSHAGLAEASYKFVGWGVRFFDVDDDGDLDLGVANGHPIDNIEKFETAITYRERAQLFLNDGHGRFQEATNGLGGLEKDRPGRGLVVFDYNNDGRLDLLLLPSNDEAVLLENEAPKGNHWIGFVLEGPPGNREAIGARLELDAGPLRQSVEVRSGGSYMSQQDLRPHFGLGAYSGPLRLHLHWPDGTVQEEKIDRRDRYVTVRYRPGPSASEEP